MRKGRSLSMEEMLTPRSIRGCQSRWWRRIVRALAGLLTCHPWTGMRCQSKLLMAPWYD